MSLMGCGFDKRFHSIVLTIMLAVNIYVYENLCYDVRTILKEDCLST